MVFSRLDVPVHRSLFGEDSFIVVGDGLNSNSQPEYSTIITMQQLMNSEIFANVPA
jgi:hypothetical protein